MTEATQRTSDSGVSIWLDDLSRSRIESGSLQDLIANKNVVGVTTNPSIFQKALSLWKMDGLVVTPTTFLSLMSSCREPDSIRVRDRSSSQIETPLSDVR